MKRLAINTWFSLPRLGSQVFSDLMRSRIQYDPKLGFKITSSTNVSRVLQILSEALGEPVGIMTSCFICEKPLGREQKKDAVVCSECLASDDAYAMYTMKFVRHMDV
jgi:hypothetical protein